MIAEDTTGTEQFTVLEWGIGYTGPDYKITAHKNGDGWLILLQRKDTRKWCVEESWHSYGRPIVSSENARGDSDD